ncbi:MAG: Rossmann fold domain-containing protein [Sphingomonadaceae bacterium]
MQHLLRIDELPDAAMGAATDYYRVWQEKVTHLLDTLSDEQADKQDSLVIIMAPAGYDHDDWRRAIVRDLARVYAPLRINLVAGDDGPALDQTLSYLARAPGITGQYLQLAGTNTQESA